MSTAQEQVMLPVDVLTTIDALVGAGQRSAFLISLAEADFRRRRLLQIIEESRTQPIWSEADHPELAEGSEAWVRKLRAEGESRIAFAEAAWQRE